VIARPFVPNRPARLQETCETGGQSKDILEYSPHTMQVIVRIWRAIVVDNNVDAFNVYPTAENVGRYQDALLKRFECRVSINAEI
jgi:hypothetical protein